MSRPKIFSTSPRTCTGCHICEMVCSLSHEKTGVNPKRSRIRIISVPEKGVIFPAVCRFCEKASCIAACPVQALSKNVGKGVIIVDEDKCVGCGRCMEACEFSGISIHPTKKTAMVCDLCGGEPLCVKYCVDKAIVFCKPEEYVVAKGIAQMNKTESSIWPGPA